MPHAGGWGDAVIRRSRSIAESPCCARNIAADDPTRESPDHDHVAEMFVVHECHRITPALRRSRS